MISSCYACRFKKERSGFFKMTKQITLYRDIQKIVRVTKEENMMIKNRMAQHNFSNFNTFARHMILFGKVVTIDYSELAKLRTEISRIGNNINQLAKYVNTNEEISVEQFLQIDNYLKDIRKLIIDYSESRESQIESSV